MPAIPLSGEPGSLRTEAWIKATPNGLAVAFRNVQPAGVPRSQQRTRRDPPFGEVRPVDQGHPVHQ